MVVRKKTHFKFILAADCETTGVCIRNKDPLYNETTGERHQAISWGIIVVDADTLEPVEELYLEVKWNERSKEQRAADPKFGKFAEGIHGLTFDYLEENGVEEEEAVVEIVNLIMKYWGVSSPLSCLGHNVMFDIKHMQALFERYNIDIAFSQRNIDSFGVGFTCFSTYDSDELFNLTSGTIRDAHSAIDDIRLTLKAIQVARSIVQEALDG